MRSKTRHILLFFLLFGLDAAFAQSYPEYEVFEHSRSRLFEATLLKLEGHAGQNSVKPRLYPASFLALDSDTLYPKFGVKKNWLLRKLFSEHLVQIKKEDWVVNLNPVFDLGVGREFSGREFTWVNSRGAQLHGSIGEKLVFFTTLYENQAMFPAYLDSFISNNRVVPGQGLARKFGQGWDYANATAYVAYIPSKYINIQLGQNRHFIGDGYRSLFLSDASFPSPFIRIQADIGQIQYTYWLMQHMDLEAPPVSWKFGYRQKYAAMSYLNWKINKRLELGGFQAVIWQADDEVGGRRVMPWQYLNPIIFYHPIQFSSGSEGNLLLGLSGKYRFLNQSYVYGQLLLDELSLSDFFKQNGAARNKYGVQLGVKSHSAFRIPNLFLQTELNLVRPYTYSHWTSLTNYAHYNQSIAHPAGANFKEWLVIGDYRLKHGFYAQLKFVWSQTGLDEAGINYGQDVMNSYLSAPGGYEGTGISIGRGAKAELLHGEVAIGKVINPVTNMQLEMRYVFRQSGLVQSPVQTNWLMFGLRTSLRNLYYDF